MFEITTAGLEVAVLGALGGLLTYFLNQFVVEWYQAAVRTKRLRDALLVDCVEILYRVNNLPLQYHRATDDCDRAVLRQVMKHPNGFVMCGPLSETRELVTLLDQRGSRLVVRFFERWKTFSILESRYSVIYQKLLETAAQCTDESERKYSTRALREEYWEQLRSSLAAMQDAGKDLCFFACQLFRHLGKFNDVTLAKYSAQRWKSWVEFEREFRRYAPRTANVTTSSVSVMVDRPTDGEPSEPGASPQAADAAFGGPPPPHMPLQAPASDSADARGRNSSPRRRDA